MKIGFPYENKIHAISILNICKKNPNVNRHGESAGAQWFNLTFSIILLQNFNLNNSKFSCSIITYFKEVKTLPELKFSCSPQLLLKLL
jgi:hypothetical protein